MERVPRKGKGEGRGKERGIGTVGLPRPKS